MSIVDQFYYSLFLPFVDSYNHFIVAYFILVNSLYLLMLGNAFVAIRQHMKHLRYIDLKVVFHSPFFKPVSILVPAYNEELSISSNLNSILQLHYPQFEVIVINDGSTDGTMEELKREFKLSEKKNIFRKTIRTQAVKKIYSSDLYSNLIVIDKDNGGKADAINAGINISSFPLFCAIDADSILEPDVLLKIVRPFIEDRTVVAAGGTIRILNGCNAQNGYVSDVSLPKSLLARFQIIEYLRAFLAGRVAFSAIGGLMIISGAFGIFKKDPVLEVGGFNPKSIGEDMELVVRMHRMLREKGQPYKMVFVPEPVCWTEAPENLKDLGSQRKRWARGLMETLIPNISMLFNPRYGIIGMFCFPFFLFLEGLGCVIEFFGVILFIVSWYFQLVNPEMALLFILGAVVLNVFLSLGSILFEEMTFMRYPKVSDILNLSFLTILETFYYRPIHTWWRLVGTFQYFAGTKKVWGEMTRIKH